MIPAVIARSSASAGGAAPPAASVDKPDYGRHYPSWATTKREDWCGEHEHILH